MIGYTVDDLESGLRHLKDVLSVACDIKFGLPAGEVDNRVDSLLWIAGGIAKAVHEYHATPPAERLKGGDA
ncbi:hypothetical protein C7441_12538 [Pseudaminobacter salicylatoxidans]|uniref:Uncharacterized protein n=1 Tax=Pseudaminobacter salicylatoxidans TaxID=93369 RepID=A0A316BL67_PSESE|nr:hypothetical protein [Pseudaminobacter salicylatoxidans]PWJ73854.1 hypothetical protein C7441_12538 [Pseudaminobacter salicylatoxidans]